jgi:hypothetical protein
MDLTNRNLGTEETRKLIFLFTRCWTRQKGLLFFFSFHNFNERNIKTDVVLRMSLLSSSFFLKCNIMYPLHCGCPPSVDRKTTSRKCLRFVGCVCVFVCVCVCVCFYSVSVWLLLCFVTVLFLSV